jgi:hypothetical protein
MRSPSPFSACELSDLEGDLPDLHESVRSALVPSPPGHWARGSLVCGREQYRGAGGAQNGAQSALGKYFAPPGRGPGHRSASGQMYIALIRYSHLTKFLHSAPVWSVFQRAPADFTATAARNFGWILFPVCSSLLQSGRLVSHMRAPISYEAKRLPILP